MGTLDTKGDLVAYLCQALIARHCRPTVIDVGVMAPAEDIADVPASAVAAAAGRPLADLSSAGDRGQAMAVMSDGAVAIVARLHRHGDIEAIVGIGGSGGSTIASRAMRALPFGFPKVLVSTFASGDTRPYIGASDITMVNPIADLAGLNHMTRHALETAAGAVVGMLAGGPRAERDRPAVAASMFGVTTRAVDAARGVIDGCGYETLVFHATGTGGLAMEAAIDEGMVDGSLDLTTTELADELVGGVLSAGPHRLEAAGRAGIPQAVSVGALDMVNFGPRPSVPERFADRTLHEHNASVTLMRTSVEECRQLGAILAAKLNAARGPTALFLPLGGLSDIDRPGRPFHSPAADRALFDSIRTTVGPSIELIESDANAGDPEMGVAMATWLAAHLTAAPKKIAESAASGASGASGARS
jgi:uncharacterized protein (UPF0261 family)